jgi:hypothetical protein
VLRLFTALDQHHPHEPHSYLPIIGTLLGQVAHGPKALSQIRKILADLLEP